jgi:chemotaxis protein MotB
MLFIIGSLAVVGSVVGGYMALGGHVDVLWQPFEFVIIGGAGIGAFIIGNSGTVQKGILKSFAPASVAATTSGSGDVLGGTSMATVEGALNEPTSFSVTVDLPPPKAGSGSEDADERDISKSQAEEVVRQEEEKQFKEAEEEIKATLADLPQLKQLTDSLVIDQTPEGLRIQIVDQEGLAMFPNGSAQMFGHTRSALSLVGKVIKKMPRAISITGHTDAVKFGSGATYTNWELSADRANSTRRALIQTGVEADRLAKVIGAAANDPLVVDDPENARNRRIAIVLLRGTGEKKKADAAAEDQ